MTDIPLDDLKRILMDMYHVEGCDATDSAIATLISEYEKRDAEIERLRAALNAIVERYEREYKAGVAWDMVQIADEALKGGE